LMLRRVCVHRALAAAPAVRLRLCMRSVDPGQRERPSSSCHSLSRERKICAFLPAQVRRRQAVHIRHVQQDGECVEAGHPRGECKHGALLAQAAAAALLALAWRASSPPPLSLLQLCERCQQENYNLNSCTPPAWHGTAIACSGECNVGDKVVWRATSKSGVPAEHGVAMDWHTPGPAFGLACCSRGGSWKHVRRESLWAKARWES